MKKILGGAVKPVRIHVTDNATTIIKMRVISAKYTYRVKAGTHKLEWTE